MYLRGGVLRSIAIRIAALAGAAGVCALAAGCPGSRQTAAVTVDPTEVDSEDPAVPREELTRDLEATVMENYSHLTLGNFGAFRDGLSPEMPVTLIGVTPEDVVAGRRPAAAGRDRRLYRALGPTLLTKNLEIQLSEDGSVGWLFDEMSYRVPYGGRTASIPIRNTSLFVRDFDRWVLVMEHLSYAVSIDGIRGLAASGRLVTPAELPSRYQIAPARELLRLVTSLHNAGPTRALAAIRAAPGTLVLLPDRDHEMRGASAAHAPSLATLFGPGTTVVLRDYRLGIAKNQKVAWMAANLAVRTVINDEKVDLGLRGTYVFELGPGGWKVVQMHLSVAVPERDLGRHIFGTQ